MLPGRPLNCKRLVQEFFGKSCEELPMPFGQSRFSSVLRPAVDPPVASASVSLRSGARLAPMAL
jgi:hypothetical protein